MYAFNIVSVAFNVIFKIPTFGYTSSLTSQVFNAAWCLVGLPFIFAALWGLAFRQEANLRMFLFYQIVSFLLDLMYTIAFFLMTDVCVAGVLPGALQRHGESFACGSMRLFSFAFVAIMTIASIYFIFTIWSICEDLKIGGSGTGFPQLLGHAREYRKHAFFGGYPSGGTFGGSGNAQRFPNQDFGYMRAPALGNDRICHGTFHETTYPPPIGFGF